MSCTEHLVKLLGTYKVFDWNCQYMHWVVTGPVFDNFHAKMQEYYEYSREAVDQLGERVQMLAGDIPSQACEVIGLSDIKFLTSKPDMQSAIKIAVKMHDYLIDFLKKGIIIGTEENDYMSEDMLRGFCAWHEKQKRLLESRVGRDLVTKTEDNGEATDPESDETD